MEAKNESGHQKTAKPSEVRDVPWVAVRGPDGAAPYDPDSVGKWMVFVPTAELDARWEPIRAATVEGRLGPAAKSATSYASPLARSANEKVIIVYTRDWKDKADVQRVLTELRGLGISWRLSYKTDAATHARRYGQGVATYVSQPGSLDFDDRSGS
jgi:Domain of unknown function (DUF1917)